MGVPEPSPVGGFVLAGGRSSRMGQDKALVKLAGKPLVQHAVEKLQRVCAEVRILTANAALEAFAPIVPDLHPDSGPMGGFEAALTRSNFAWNLIMPVDTPFLPSSFLDGWVRETLPEEGRGVRIAIFTVDGMPQPTLALVHRDVLPFCSRALDRGEFKLFPMLERAGKEIARGRGMADGTALLNRTWDPGWYSSGEVGITNAGPGSACPGSAGVGSGAEGGWRVLTERQRAMSSRWFANLNHPEDLRDTEDLVGVLDT